MSRRIAALVLTGISFGVGSAVAQESPAVPGTFEVTVMPASASYSTSNGARPSYGRCGLGTAATFNFNRFVGIEGEVCSMTATAPHLQLGDRASAKPPTVLDYTGNVIVSLTTGHSLVPYVAGGVGGLTMFARRSLGVFADETSLSGNLGGGVKWYARNGHWGLRGDYRFVMTQSNDAAPAVFGRDARYVHRLYAGLLINPGW